MAVLLQPIIGSPDYGNPSAAGMSRAALTAAIQPYLPIVSVLVILGGAVPVPRERLMQRVESALRSED